MSERADCYFETASHLTKLSKAEIAARTGVEIPQRGSGGVSEEDMRAANNTLGFRDHPTLTTKTLRTPCADELEAPTTQNVGVAYTRRDGSGHVVVRQNEGKPYERYIDRQNPLTSQKDLRKDIKESSVKARFSRS